MIQRRKSWGPDPRVTLENASTLQDLLELLVRRYQLIGGVIADRNGVIQAQSGGAVNDLQQLAAIIDVSVLPRYYANGPLDAYVDLIGEGMIALVMRERGLHEERTELGMVGDYDVAKQLMNELRTALARLQS
jgi:hypothetical protein